MTAEEHVIAITDRAGHADRVGQGESLSARWAAFAQAHPLVRRVTGYSAGSVIAAITSEAAFAASYGWGHVGTTAASAFGFVGGAVPNYILNRRWAWRDRRGRSPRQEVVLYAVVALASFVVSAVATNWAEDGARSLTSSHDWEVALVALAYLGVSAVFFAVKFVIYELLVFTKGSAASGPPAGASEPMAEANAPAGGMTGSEPAA